ncbi:MAG: NUDIX hydrolase [Lentimicrobiaceae bacterium]|jgi:8-oxo-dGTP diphosphatase
MKHCYDYPRPAVTADIIILKKINNQTYLLLIERKHPPFEGMWAFPGGFLNMDETLEEAALRELQEETGISGVELRQFHTFSKVNRDPRHRTITTVFIGFTDDTISIEAGDDAAKTQRFSIDKLPPLAFDNGEVMEMVKVSL